MRDHRTFGAAGASRRGVLKWAGGCVAAVAALRHGLVGLAHAAQRAVWPAEAFRQTAEPNLLRLYGQAGRPEESEQIALEVPEIAENGAVVPVRVATTLPDTTRIALIVPNNPFVLAASYDIPKGTDPSVSCRIKMAKTSDVVALVESRGRLYSTSQSVKVTLGGCG